MPAPVRDLYNMNVILQESRLALRYFAARNDMSAQAR